MLVYVGGTVRFNGRYTMTEDNAALEDWKVEGLPFVDDLQAQLRRRRSALNVLAILVTDRAERR